MKGIADAVVVLLLVFVAVSSCAANFYCQRGFRERQTKRCLCVLLSRGNRRG